MTNKGAGLPLIVFALEQESQGLFSEYPCLYTGVGKLNAAYTLLKYLSSEPRPPLIINLGTAGSATINAQAPELNDYNKSSFAGGTFGARGSCQAK